MERRKRNKRIMQHLRNNNNDDNVQWNNYYYRNVIFSIVVSIVICPVVIFVDATTTTTTTTTTAKIATVSNNDKKYNDNIGHHHHQYDYPQSLHDLQSKQIHSISDIESMIEHPSNVNNDNNNNNQHDQLTAIIHIGPQKTASTSIQQTMIKVQSELYNDSYEKVADINKQGSHGFAQCFKIPLVVKELDTNTTNTNNTTTCNDWVSSTVQVDYNCYQKQIYDCTNNIAKQRNHNLLVSAESLSNNNVNTTLLYNYVHTYWKQTKVIIVYRRFYSWLVSYHNQHFKYKLPMYGKEFIDFISFPTNRIQLLYDGYYIPGPIHNFYTATISNQDNTKNTIHIINPYELKRISNVYNNDAMKNKQQYIAKDYVGNSYDITEYFYCTVIPNATNACLKTRQLLLQQQQKQQKQQQHKRKLLSTAATGTTSTTNSEQSLVYNEIAYYALNSDDNPQWGFNSTQIRNDIISIIEQEEMQQQSNSRIRSSKTSISNTSIQKVLVTKIKYYNEIVQNRTSYNFLNVLPECPTTKFLDYIYNISILTEQLLFPNYYNTKNGSIELYNDFYYNYILKYKFCTIRGHTVINNNSNEWKNFFSDIKNY